MKNYDFGKGKRGPTVKQRGKTRVTIYLDNDLLESFRERADATGRGYQARRAPGSNSSAMVKAFTGRTRTRISAWRACWPERRVRGLFPAFGRWPV